MRLRLGVFGQYGDHLGPDGAGGPGESLPAALRAGGKYKRPLTAVCLTWTLRVVIQRKLPGRY